MKFSPKKAVISSKAPDPVGPYNQAVIANGWLYCSGQIAIDPQSGSMISNGTIEDETKQVLNNLTEVLREAGATAKNVIKSTIYLVDLKDFEKVNKIYAEFFREGISPARACVEVSALPKGAKVEIDCVAWLGNAEQ